MRLPWIVVGILVAALAAGVVVLDRRQAARGQPSVLVSLGWPAASRPRSPTARAPRPSARPARVAVIVDELGGRADVAERVLALRRPVAVAVLPELPLSRRIARDAARAGLEVLVQLASMAPAEVTRRTRQHLAAVPGAVGVVTRMGSRFTEDRRQMRAVLEPVFLQGLFFVDSLTTPRSVGYDLARALGIPAGRRQIFLDPDESEATARARLGAVERWATRRGAVLAIAHGRLLTLRLLEEALPGWEARGVRLSPVSELVKAEARASGS
jgi:polysaccharide deacetylase 2 family uncharacterized protein YibQ